MAARASGPVVVRRRLGNELRRLREQANLRLDDVASEMEFSPSKLSRLENGQAIPKTWDVKNLLTLYEVHDPKLRDRLLRWANEGKAQGWWQPFSAVLPSDTEYYLALEAEAAAISMYSTPIISALFQTRNYARAVLSSIRPELDAHAIEQLVEVRMRRQEVMRRSDEPIKMRAVFDEAALKRTVGSPEIMRQQLSALLEVSNAAEFRVYRLSSGVHPLSVTPMTIFVPRVRDLDPIVINLESIRHEGFLEDANEVQWFQKMFDNLWNGSDDEVESRALIHSMLA